MIRLYGDTHARIGALLRVLHREQGVLQARVLGRLLQVVVIGITPGPGVIPITNLLLPVKRSRD